VELPMVVRAGMSALLRTNGNVEFQTGDLVRVLDATLTKDGEDEEQLLVITLNALSETYTV